MGTISFITPDEVSSASKLNTDFKSIQDMGTQVLQQLQVMQTSTLVDYERRLEALALRQSRAAKVLPAGVVAQFTLSDWSLINQTTTTATVRVDSQTATLREKRQPGTVVVANTSFATSAGTVQVLDQKGTLYRVTSGVPPTVIFTLTLADAVQLNLITFTLSALASTPDVKVSVSPDNVVYTPATNLQIVGSTLTAWFSATPVLYVRLEITTTHADDLDGEAYTFGITDATGTSISYALISDLYFKPITVSPMTASWILRAPSDPGLQYFCRLTGPDFDSGFVEYHPGDSIPVPGCSGLQQTQTTDTGAGLLNPPVNGVSVPYGIDNSLVNGKVYPWSIRISTLNGSNEVPLPLIIDKGQFSDSQSIPRIVGTESESYAGFTKLSKTYAVGQGFDSWLIAIVPPINLGDPLHPQQYVCNWIYGPSEVNIEFYVHISTSDRNKTPVFTGLSLEEN